MASMSVYAMPAGIPNPVNRELVRFPELEAVSPVESMFSESNSASPAIVNNAWIPLNTPPVMGAALPTEMVSSPSPPRMVATAPIARTRMASSARPASIPNPPDVCTTVIASLPSPVFSSVDPVCVWATTTLSSPPNVFRIKFAMPVYCTEVSPVVSTVLDRTVISSF